MAKRLLLMVVALMSMIDTFADITVSDVEVFSGYPWKEVVVGYTITGTSGQDLTLELMATDKSANKTYTAKTLADAETTSGRHVLRWNAAAEGVNLSSDKVVFTVTLLLGVQLWENGPYWAECNVGASQPEEYGYYFWWGDTVGYKRNATTNGWVSVANGEPFSFEAGGCPTYGKDYSSLQSTGYIDSTGNLVAEYDAAAAHLGSRWRMPTDVEWNALVSNCDTTWTTLNGVSGRLVRGRGKYASKTIFLPAAGYGRDSDLYLAGSNGYYGSSTLYSGNSSNAWSLYCNSGDSNRTNDGRRYYGQSVRPLRGSAQ